MTVSHWIEVIFRAIQCFSKGSWYNIIKNSVFYDGQNFLCQRGEGLQILRILLRDHVKFSRSINGKIKIYQWNNTFCMKPDSFNPEELLQHLTMVIVQHCVSSSLFWSKDLRWPHHMLNMFSILAEPLLCVICSQLEGIEGRNKLQMLTLRWYFRIFSIPNSYQKVDGWGGACQCV